ncbi:MAG: EAL domain-containing protein [Methylobacter sp.]|nr:EAL domain-containing protein [Methylobacter sp.]
MKAIDEFTIDRKNIQDSHINVAKALTEDSFLVLEQFAELLAMVKEFSSYEENPQHHIPALDENWSQWQLSWGMENVTFFNHQAVMLKSWGSQLLTSASKVKQVLLNETPEHQIFCSDNCYQQTIIPVIGKSEATGAFSVIRSFADVIIKYKRATSSDIGVLVADATVGDSDTAEKQQWGYKLWGMTLPDKNVPVFEYISRNYTIAELWAHSKTVKMAGSVFEVRVLPVQQNTTFSSPFFLLVDDITSDVEDLDKNLKHVWLYGIISLSGSLILLILVLHLSLGRVAMLSQALPLLSQNQYDRFRKEISIKKNFTVGYDELDKLNHTALTLTDQLEHLVREVRNNTFMLMEKSQDLAIERDFIRQLVEVAPIIIITQKLNGMILTINQAGVDSFEADSRSIIGKVFDVFLPESDREHLRKLNQLRIGERTERFQVDGLLVTESGNQRDTSWLHSVLKSNSLREETVILTLGVDMSVSKIAEEKIFRLSAYDYLTGLGNRRKFQEEFALELARAKRHGYQVALFYLDLDRFKVISDDSDYEIGDNLLVQVADVLRQTIRSTDLLCRVGGDEFALIIHHSEVPGVDCIARKINAELMAHSFSFRGKTYQVSASIGIAMFPVHGLTINELLANADLAVHQAKESGREQYHIFSPDYDYQVKLNLMLYWQEIIEDAILKDKFILLYQPILNIKTNVIDHFECLIRLQQDDVQLMPADFIGHAEELGLIGKVDRLMLKKVVQKHIELNRQGKDYKLAVNLSGCSFNDATIFEYISRLLNIPEVMPGKIIIEITEASTVANFSAAEILINQIRDLGCLFALDGFGMGFSSFYCLKHFPADYVKIDCSLIRNIDKSDDDKIFVKALTGAAQAFGKKTVADFVENEAILVILKEFGTEFGINYAQGYHIGKPGPLH